MPVPSKLAASLHCRVGCGVAVRYAIKSDKSDKSTIPAIFTLPLVPTQQCLVHAARPEATFPPAIVNDPPTNSLLSYSARARTEPLVPEPNGDNSDQG